ncbi:MAG TPA: alpha/beta hydrolase [Sphingomonadaceae bacterium]|nr:alpha/beta hydrolase [Sphingomonadaceae bacterium]
MTWSIAFAAVFIAALAGAYLWARENRSVAMLDRVDRLFTGGLSGKRVDYGDHPRQHLVVYGSESGEPKPIVVFIHGGSWREGSPEDYGFIARNLAREGYVTVLAGYRLGEEGRFPAMLEDGAAALAWVHTHAAGFGGDPARIFLMGHSAGAYNVVMLALDRQWLGREGLDSSFISGVIGLAGPYDFYPFDTDSTRRAFGAWPRPEATQPVRFARADAPPMLLASGSGDETVRPRNSLALAAALTEAGRPTQAVVMEGLDHVGILIALARPLDLWDGRPKQAVLAFLAENRDAGSASAPVQQEDP